MTDYFNSQGYREDYRNLLKALLLISRKLEALTEELSGIKENLNKENNADKLVTPPNK